MPGSIRGLPEVSDGKYKWDLLAWLCFASVFFRDKLDEELDLMRAVFFNLLIFFLEN